MSLGPKVTFRPLTRGRWEDLETLFGPRGACGGCWCMYWRLSRPRFEAQKGDANRRALRKIAGSGRPPGILAYEGRKAVGWCALAPRSEYPTLGRSRVLKPVDDLPVWSITCLFVARPARRQGLSVRLLRAAAEFAGRAGARALEGYPIHPRGDCVPDAFAWTGLASAFEKAGFVEVARRSETRPIFRLGLRETSPPRRGRTGRR